MTKLDNPIIQVLVNNKPIQTFYKDGLWYIAGKPGTEYKIRIHNPDKYRRAEAILSVDGLDVITAKTAGSNCEGYIIPANSYIDIDGFRISQDSVRGFVFSEASESYAAKKAAAEAATEPLNIGVIGCITYLEKVIPNNYYYYAKYGNAFLLGNDLVYQTEYTTPQTYSFSITNQNMPIRSAQKSIGTGMGDKKDSKVTFTSFERDEYSKTMSIIYYDTLEKLVEKNIVNKNNIITSNRPNPFPNDINYFCPEY